MRFLKVRNLFVFLFFPSARANGICGEIIDRIRGELIQYEVIRTDIKFMFRVGFEPGSFRRRVIGVKQNVEV